MQLLEPGAEVVVSWEVFGSELLPPDEPVETAPEQAARRRQNASRRAGDFIEMGIVES